MVCKLHYFCAPYCHCFFRSQTFEAHSLTPLPRMSLMLTHVAFAGPPSGAKTRVDILYEGARGEMICCSIGTLIRGFVSIMIIPFLADMPLKATRRSNFIFVFRLSPIKNT